MTFMAKAQEVLTYNFDGGTMMGWTSIDTDGDGYGWVMGSAIGGVYLGEGGSLAGSGHNASQDMVCSGSFSNVVGALTPNNYLVSPDKGAYSQISFWACGQDSDYPAEHFGVAVSTESIPENFTMIQEWTLTDKGSGVKSYGRGGQTREQGSWYEFTADLSAYAGHNIWVAIRHFNCSDEFVLDVDDITITMGEAPLSDFIDFETGDFSQYTFTNDATYPWAVVTADNGSQYCMKSGNGGVSSSTSSISLSRTYPAPGYILFDYNCMGEGTSSFWDHCDFAIDGNVVMTHGADHQGWDMVLFQITTTGEHTFTWSYTKDSSENPTGDYFAVDNIEFGEGDSPCVTPNRIAASGIANGFNVSWNGYADSFTLEYKMTTAGTWTTIAGITEQEYQVTGLAAGTYNVRVQSDCDAGNWCQTTAEVIAVNSTATWYGYATYSPSGASYEQHFINFTMQELSNVTAASATTFPNNYAAAYADGYVWGITQSEGNLFKATVDNNNHTIGEYELVVSGLVGSGYVATTMSYNSADNKMYYICNDGSSTLYLISFSTSNPSATNTQIGMLSNTLITLAINANGEAYGIEVLTGDLYSINLTNAQTTLVGATGVGCDYVQDMAFDVTTGELFWAQCHSSDANGIYLVNPQTANATFMGMIGGQGMELTGMFMVPSNAGVNEVVSESIDVYPNPAKDMLYIEGIEGYNVGVYDAMGRLVIQTVYNGHLNVSELPVGLYIVRFGENSVRFIKE